jgi:hypothetical protein
MLHALCVQKGDYGAAAETHWWIRGSIRPDRFAHPLTGTYAETNRHMQAHIIDQGWEGCLDQRGDDILLDLPVLASMQLQQAGVPKEHIDIRRDRAYFEPAFFWDTRDGVGGKDSRNLILVARL